MSKLWNFPNNHLFRVALLILVLCLSSPAQALNWKTQVVDGNGNTGWFSSLAVNGSGMPNIAYKFWDPGTNTRLLRYALWDGNAWVFDDIDNSADPSSISLYYYQGVVGYPQVTYYEFKTSSLKYAYKKILPPFGWAIETVDNTVAGVGWGISPKPFYLETRLKNGFDSPSKVMGNQ